MGEICPLCHGEGGPECPQCEGSGVWEPEYKPEDAFGLIRSIFRHISFVKLALRKIGQDLEDRAAIHDLSKLSDEEFAGFARINKHARVHKFGSPEYEEGMRQEREIIDLHFSRNRHHPEFFRDDPEAPSVESMTFLDVIEMVCDWWGAGKGYDSTMPWFESVRRNLDSKGKYLSPEARWLVWQVAYFLDEQFETPDR